MTDEDGVTGGLGVVGAGFGRTGTLSLKHALQMLGFGPTYHMEEVLRRPSHIRAWQRFATDGTADWDRLFAHFGSGVDFPVSCAWRELAAHYPDAKVILTVRDADRWWASTAETIHTTRDLFPRWLQRLVPWTAAYLDMNERLVWDGLFAGRFSDRAHAIEVYDRHNAEVAATVPPERLLVFDVAQGWEPLCRFLEVPVPDRPFPNLNDKAVMQRRLQAVRIGTRLLPLPAVAGALLAGRAAFRQVGRRR
jgi:hypothetical protein